MGYLHKAIILGNSALLHALLTLGQDPNSRDEYGATPLHTACFAANTDAIDTLLSFKCNVDLQLQSLLNNHEWTALHIALFSGHAPVALRLLQAGATANIQDETGMTPALILSQQVLLYAPDQFQELLESLLEKCMGKLPQSNAGLGLAHYIVKAVPNTIEESQRQIEALHFLSQASPMCLNQTSKFGQSPLWLAAQGGNPEVVACLLQAGADPSIADCNGNLPLHMAVSAGSLPSVHILASAQEIAHTLRDQVWLQKGDIQQMYNTVRENDEPEVDREALDSARKLKAEDSCLDRQNRAGASSLAMACCDGKADIVRALLDAGANPVKAPPQGLSPLQLACLDNSAFMPQQQEWADTSNGLQESNSNLQKVASFGEEQQQDEQDSSALQFAQRENTWPGTGPRSARQSEQQHVYQQQGMQGYADLGSKRSSIDSGSSQKQSSGSVWEMISQKSIAVHGSAPQYFGDEIKVDLLNSQGEDVNPGGLSLADVAHKVQIQQTPPGSGADVGSQDYQSPTPNSTISPPGYSPSVEPSKYDYLSSKSQATYTNEASPQVLPEKNELIDMSDLGLSIYNEHVISLEYGIDSQPVPGTGPPPQLEQLVMAPKSPTKLAPQLSNMSNTSLSISHEPNQKPPQPPPAPITKAPSVINKHTASSLSKRRTVSPASSKRSNTPLTDRRNRSSSVRARAGTPLRANHSAVSRSATPLGDNKGSPPTQGPRKRANTPKQERQPKPHGYFKKAANRVNQTDGQQQRQQQGIGPSGAEPVPGRVRVRQAQNIEAYHQAPQPGSTAAQATSQAQGWASQRPQHDSARSRDKSYTPPVTPTRSPHSRGQGSVQVHPNGSDQVTAGGASQPSQPSSAIVSSTNTSTGVPDTTPAHQLSLNPWMYFYDESSNYNAIHTSNVTQGPIPSPQQSTTNAALQWPFWRTIPQYRGLLTDRSLHSVDGPPNGPPPAYQMIPNRPIIDTISSVMTMHPPQWLSSRTQRTNLSDDSWRVVNDPNSAISGVHSSTLQPIDQQSAIEQEMSTLILSAKGSGLALRNVASRLFTRESGGQVSLFGDGNNSRNSFSRESVGDGNGVEEVYSAVKTSALDSIHEDCEGGIGLTTSCPEITLPGGAQSNSSLMGRWQQISRLNGSIYEETDVNFDVEGINGGADSVNNSHNRLLSGEGQQGKRGLELDQVQCVLGQPLGGIAPVLLPGGFLTARADRDCVKQVPRRGSASARLMQKGLESGLSSMGQAYNATEVIVASQEQAENSDIICMLLHVAAEYLDLHKLSPQSSAEQSVLNTSLQPINSDDSWQHRNIPARQVSPLGFHPGMEYKYILQRSIQHRYLELATSMGFFEASHFILKHPRFISLPMPNTTSPLHIAAMHQDVRIMYSLLCVESFKLAVNYCNEKGHTPLEVTAQYGGSCACMEMLIKVGARITTGKDGEGDTVLHMAMRERLGLHVTRLLLEATRKQEGRGEYKVATNRKPPCLARQDVKIGALGGVSMDGHISEEAEEGEVKDVDSPKLAQLDSDEDEVDIASVALLASTTTPSLINHINAMGLTAVDVHMANCEPMPAPDDMAVLLALLDAGGVGNLCKAHVLDSLKFLQTNLDKCGAPEYYRRKVTRHIDAAQVWEVKEPPPKFPTNPPPDLPHKDDTEPQTVQVRRVITYDALNSRRVVPWGTVNQHMIASKESLKLLTYTGSPQLQTYQQEQAKVQQHKQLLRKPMNPAPSTLSHAVPNNPLYEPDPENPSLPVPDTPSPPPSSPSSSVLTPGAEPRRLTPRRPAKVSPLPLLKVAGYKEGQDFGAMSSSRDVQVQAMYSGKLRFGNLSGRSYLVAPAFSVTTKEDESGLGSGTRSSVGTKESARKGLGAKLQHVVGGIFRRPQYGGQRSTQRSGSTSTRTMWRALPQKKYPELAYSSRDVGGSKVSVQVKSEHASNESATNHNSASDGDSVTLPLFPTNTMSDAHNAPSLNAKVVPTGLPGLDEISSESASITDTLEHALSQADQNEQQEEIGIQLHVSPQSSRISSSRPTGILGLLDATPTTPDNKGDSTARQYSQRDYDKACAVAGVLNAQQRSFSCSDIQALLAQTYRESLQDEPLLDRHPIRAFQESPKPKKKAKRKVNLDEVWRHAKSFQPPPPNPPSPDLSHHRQNSSTGSASQSVMSRFQSSAQGDSLETLPRINTAQKERKAQPPLLPKNWAANQLRLLRTATTGARNPRLHEALASNNEVLQQKTMLKRMEQLLPGEGLGAEESGREEQMDYAEDYYLSPRLEYGEGGFDKIIFGM